MEEYQWASMKFQASLTDGTRFKRMGGCASEGSCGLHES